MIIRRLPRLFPRTPLQHLLASPYVKFPYSTLRTKINSASNLNQYLQLFRNQQDNFTGQVALRSVPKLIQLLDTQRKINFKSMGEHISLLESIEMSECSQQDLKKLLRFIGKLEESRDLIMINKPWSNLMKKVGDYMLVLLQHKQYQAQDLILLLQYLSLLTCQDQNYVFYPLQKKILGIIDSKMDVSVPRQIAYKYFQILTKKLYLQSLDIRLCDVFLLQLGPEITKMPLQQLLNFCIVLNQIDHCYFSRNEKDIIRNMFSLLAEQTQNLQENEIIRLLSETQHSYNVNNLTKSYVKIQNLLLNQLAQDGTTPLDSDLVFMLFNSLAKKRAIFKMGAKNQHKFYKFIQLYLKQVRQRQTHQYIAVTYTISLMVQRKFMAQRQQISELVGLLGRKIHIHLLYILAVKHYQVDHLIPHNTVDLKDNKYPSIVKRAIILKKSLLSKPNQSFQKELSSIEEYLQHMLKEQQFSKKLLNSLLNEDPTKSLNNHFFQFFSQLLLKNLANPFQEECNDKFYILSYCQFIIHVKDSALQQRRKQIQGNMNQLNLFKIVQQQTNIMEHIDQPPQSSLLNIINNTFTEVVVPSNFIYGKLFPFLGRIFRYVIHDRLDHIVKEHFWRIIYKILAFCKSKEYDKHDDRIQSLLKILLTVQHTPFRISPKFKAFVATIADQFHVFKNILQANVIREVLSLNVKNQHIINHISPQNVQKLPLPLRQKHRILQDPEYVPSYSEQELPDTLNLIVLRPSFYKIIVQNKQIIMKKVKSMKLSVILSTLCSNQLPNSPTSRQLIKALTTELMKRINNFDSVDFQTILFKCQSNYSFQINCFSQLFNRIIAFYHQNEERRDKFCRLDPEVIYQLSKFIGTQQPALISQKDQFYELVQNYIKKASFTSKPIVLTGLLNTSFPYKQQHLKYISKIFEANFIHGLRFFLTMQSKYDEIWQKKIVTRIASILDKNIKKGGKNNVKRQIYLYLKSKYPQEMQNIQIDEKKLEPYVFCYRANYQIYNALTQACRVLGLTINTHKQLEPNIIYEINNKYIVFTSPLKTSAEHEKRLSKNMLRVILKKNLPIFDFTNDVTSNDNYIELITREGLLFSMEQTKVLKQKLNFSEMKMKTKAKSSVKAPGIS